MILHVPSLEKLVHEFSKLPGIGPKTAQRLAYHILRGRDSDVEALANALHGIKTSVRECPSCFSYTENVDLCHICRDPTRSDESLCLVEDPGDIIRIESSGVYRGRYHVLKGAISPLEGIAPEDLTIANLLEKVQNGQKGLRPEIKEVILALDADLEGDTTVLYLARALKAFGVKISRIAHGVPIGGDIDYVDHRTLGRAMENRVQL